MRTHGFLAEVWPQRALSEDYIVADVLSSAAAFVDIVETRRRGEYATFVPLFEHRRRRLLRAIVRDLIAPPEYDVFLDRMRAFARGQVSLNGNAQGDFEASFYDSAACVTFQHAALVADEVVFRSRYEIEHVASTLSYRPPNVRVNAVADPTVPAPIPAAARKHIAIWIGEGDEPFADLARRLVSDIPMEALVVRAGPEAAAKLSEAAVILSPSDDPGTAIALARFAKPLAFASPAAAEYIDGVATFDLWDASAAVDAVQRALGAATPSIPPMPYASQACRKAPKIPEAPPLVSIIVSVYDRLRHLHDTLLRLQRQTYPNIEIVVVSNNGPRADAVCAEFANVRYFHRAENSGAAGDTRNDGIRIARGVYIAALDDDDIFFDDHIARMVEICENGVDVVYSDFLIQIVDPREDGDYLLGYDIEVSTAITAHELMVINRLGYMTVFARRSVYDSFPVAYDQAGVPGGSEVELWLRMARRFVFAKSTGPTSIYTIRKNWKGSVTAVHHFIFADGYEKMYNLYPSTGTAHIEERRAAHLAQLRSSTGSPNREPRYLVAERMV